MCRYHKRNAMKKQTEMVGIMPPSPQKIWRFSSAHFSGKEFQKQTICGTISSKLYRQESTIGKEQNTNQTQVSQTYISKTNLIFFYGRSKVLHRAYFAGSIGDCCIIFESKA